MLYEAPTRRTVLAGVIAAIGSALWARAATAFPRGTDRLLDGVSRLLERFGVRVAAATDPVIERDVLRFTINPSDDIQYDQVVNDARGIFNCWVTSSFRDAVRFTNFDMSTGAPNLELSSADGQSVLAILDRTANLQVKISGGATYVLRDGELVSIG